MITELKERLKVGIVEFTYTKTNGESKHVRVEPYFLVEYRNCWYLEALYNLEERYVLAVVNEGLTERFNNYGG